MSVSPWSGSLGALLRLMEGIETVFSQFTADQLEINAARLGEAKQELDGLIPWLADGVGDRVNAGVGGNEEGRV